MHFCLFVDGKEVVCNALGDGLSLGGQGSIVDHAGQVRGIGHVAVFCQHHRADALPAGEVHVPAQMILGIDLGFHCLIIDLFGRQL